MPIFPAGPPAPLAIRGPIAALAVDARRRRIFAAGTRSIVMVDADTGKVRATIRIAGTRSIAIEPLGGHLFAGTSDGKISEVDPDRKTIVRTLEAGAPVALLLYDSETGRLYAEGGGRPALSVFDVRKFAPLPPVAIPGGIPAKIAPDPVTREFYVDFAGRPGVTIVDPVHGVAVSRFPTPGIPANAAIAFDDGLGQIVATASTGVLDTYDRAGTRRARIAVPAGISACDVDTGTHVLACTGAGGLTFVQLVREAAPHVIATDPLAGTGPVAFDSKTNDAIVARSDSDGRNTAIAHFSASPPASVPPPTVR